MRYGMRGAHQEAADMPSAARQKPGRVIVRHFATGLCATMRISQGNTLVKLRMILLSQISLDQRPIDKYEIRYGTRGAHQEAAARRGAAQLGRSQAASS